jgi:hypothetical protein
MHAQGGRVVVYDAVEGGALAILWGVCAFATTPLAGKFDASFGVASAEEMGDALTAFAQQHGPIRQLQVGGVPV